MGEGDFWGGEITPLMLNMKELFDRMYNIDSNEGWGVHKDWTLHKMAIGIPNYEYCKHDP